uniref:RskA family anti-sigma factor n=2 Tax=Nocardia cyriacigeorgica TaxID=135487 RepID=UPI002458E92F
MNERQIDLAHTVALGSIDDEDHQAVQELLDSEDPARRAEFITEVHLTREALGALAAATAVQPPAALRGRLLTAIAAEQPPVACGLFPGVGPGSRAGYRGPRANRRKTHRPVTSPGAWKG